ncbi:6066_t:CDS:2 [Racocetra fulgida]|uniref:6066_t:CDS:1 n=1 Tax=Racocetra fulgida TaxID=60492 RepID=A0A9N9NGK3_9GLOM|nr:6066_t:CDS:2 [Racocetra fulgida]
MEEKEERYESGRQDRGYRTPSNHGSRERCAYMVSDDEGGAVDSDEKEA